MIKIRDLTKLYGVNKGLNSLDIDFPQGEIIGLLGPNGSGKTTLIKTICGLIKDYTGLVEIDGMAPGKETKAIISYMPDIFMLTDFKKIIDAIEYYELVFPDFNKEKAEELLRLLKLDELMDISGLSKGMMEKFHLAMTLSREAKYYILDEPIGGVDLISRDEIISTIITQIDPNSTMIIATHLIGDIERIIDSVAFIKDGKIVELESTENIREKYAMSIEDRYREIFKGE